jgi:phosphohistidine phosphatase SixA
VGDSTRGLANSATIWLVRHGKAGDRRKWTGSDESRPLSRGGRRQAAGLAELLVDAQPRRVLSSPAARCAQTVEPVAAARGLRVEIVRYLAEGSDPAAALARLARLGMDAVACSHGDVILGMLATLAAEGLVPAAPQAPKGSTWVFHFKSANVVGATYLGPVADPTAATKRR